MAFLSLTTSLNVAELSGLHWKRINLSGKFVHSAGEAIAPYSLHVRENYYLNRWGSVKTKSRQRTVGLPDYVESQLVAVRDASSFTKPDDPVFTSRVSTPIDAHNINNRIF
jgi:hypothetical protein